VTPTDSSTEPVGLRSYQDRDVVLAVQAHPEGEHRKRAAVEMISPAEDEPVTLLCDEGAQRGGRGEEPNALAYFAASIAFCLLAQLTRAATVLKLSVEDMKVAVRTHWHIEGSILAGSVESKPLVFTERIELESDEDAEQIARLVRTAERSCYVLQSLRVEIEREVVHNGRELQVA
jgi:uncharacterized OsmC-like protein